MIPCPHPPSRLSKTLVIYLFIFVPLALSPPPSISLPFPPSLSSLLFFLSIFHTFSKCSSQVAQTYFRCTSSPLSLLQSVLPPVYLICSHFILHLHLCFTSLLPPPQPPKLSYALVSLVMQLWSSLHSPNTPHTPPIATHTHARAHSLTDVV